MPADRTTDLHRTGDSPAKNRLLAEWTTGGDLKVTFTPLRAVVWAVTYLDETGQQRVAGVLAERPGEHDLDRYFGGSYEVTEIEVGIPVNVSKGVDPYV